MSIFSDHENGYMDEFEYREECKRMNRQDGYERAKLYDPVRFTDDYDEEVENEGEPEDAFAEETEETKEMTNEEMLNKVLRNFFPRALFICENNEASHTKKIIFSEEWLIKPYRGGE